LIATLPEEFVTKTTLYRWSVALLLSLCTLLLSAAPQSVQAQSTGATVTGTVTDVRGDVLQSATVSVKNESTSNARSVKVDAQGHYSLGGLTPGRYTVEVSAPGFDLSRRTVQLNAGQDQDFSVALKVGGDLQQVTVEANSLGSIAAALAPMDASLESTSARTYISPYLCPELHLTCGRLR
jgi:iron complex outermembrane receptor protein